MEPFFIFLQIFQTTFFLSLPLISGAHDDPTGQVPVDVWPAKLVAAEKARQVQPRRQGQSRLLQRSHPPGEHPAGEDGKWRSPN